MATATAGCELQASQCAGEGGCLVLSLHAPPGQSLSAAEVILRDGEMRTRTSLWGAALTAPTVLPLAAGGGDGTRRAIYVRATSEDASGRHELRGRFEGTTATGEVHISLTAHCGADRCDVPPARHGAAMAYDPQTRSVLLHGGAGQDGEPIDDLWVWDGLGWHKLPVTPGPAARSGHVMAHDPQTGLLLLAFGQSQSQVFDDTWLLHTDSLRWQKVGGPSPGARRQAALTATQQGLVLFGGQTQSGQYLGDTWSFDGAGWKAGPSSLCESKPLLPGTLPRCRVGATLVESPEDHSALLIGGLLASSSDNAATSDDTVWRFSDGNWSMAPFRVPPFVLGRFAHGAALVRQNSQATDIWLGLGDSSVGLRQDSYLLQSPASSRPLLGPAPSPRRAAAVGFDAEREELLLFGGEGEAGVLGDTITFTAETGYVSRP